MRVFKDLELVEHMGSGIPRILQEYGRECFEFSENYVVLTFPKKNLNANAIGGQISGQISSVTEAQGAVLNLIKENPEISRATLSKTLGINKSAIQKHIEILKSKGILTREGIKGGYWNINEK